MYNKAYLPLQIAPKHLFLEIRQWCNFHVREEQMKLLCVKLKHYCYFFTAPYQLSRLSKFFVRKCDIAVIGVINVKLPACILCYKLQYSIFCCNWNMNFKALYFNIISCFYWCGWTNNFLSVN